MRSSFHLSFYYTPSLIATNLLIFFFFSFSYYSETPTILFYHQNISLPQQLIFNNRKKKQLAKIRNVKKKKKKLLQKRIVKMIFGLEDHRFSRRLTAYWWYAQWNISHANPCNIWLMLNLSKIKKKKIIIKNYDYFFNIASAHFENEKLRIAKKKKKRSCKTP